MVLLSVLVGLIEWSHQVIQILKAWLHLFLTAFLNVLLQAWLGDVHVPRRWLLVGIRAGACAIETLGHTSQAA